MTPTTLRRAEVPQLEELKLSVDQAEAIIEKGIEYGAYSDEMPDTKKEKLAAADEIVSFSIDAYINDGITSDDEDPAVAESGEQIEEILELAGVSIEDGEAVFGDAPDADGGEQDDKGGDDEAPFDPNDYIEGYTELSVVTKLKKVRELDPDNDEHAATLENLYDWENEQDKPSSRVLNYIDEVLPPADDNGEGDEQEADAENGDESEGDESASEQPWDEDKKNKIKAYDDMSAVEIKSFLTENSDDLTREQIEYVLEYEESREKPPPRKRVIDFCKTLLEEFDNGGDEPAEEEPVKPKRGRPRKQEAAPEPEADGVIVLTREHILAALENGQVEI